MSGKPKRFSGKLKGCLENQTVFWKTKTGLNVVLLFFICLNDKPMINCNKLEKTSIYVGLVLYIVVHLCTLYYVLRVGPMFYKSKYSVQCRHINIRPYIYIINIIHTFYSVNFQCFFLTSNVLFLFCISNQLYRPTNLKVYDSSLHHILIFCFVHRPGISTGCPALARRYGQHRSSTQEGDVRSRAVFVLCQPKAEK